MMQRFKKILLVARGRSEESAAVERAVRLAKENHAHLTALRVLRRLPPDVRMLAATTPPEELEKLAVEEAHEGLEQLLAPLQEQGFRVQTKVHWGKPFVEVIREVMRHRHDLVMLSAERKSHLREMLFGSMTMRLMHECPCPIWVVKSGHREPYTRVLAAVDPASEHKEAEALNSKILELASSLAQLEGSELHVVHAWELYAEGILRGRAGVFEAEVDRMVRETEALRKGMLENLLASASLAKPPQKIHLLKGTPEFVIPELVGQERIEVLVMGTVSRAGISGFLMGSTAERMLHQADCSVLALKPDGFVTSIKLDEG